MRGLATFVLVFAGCGRIGFEAVAPQYELVIERVTHDDATAACATRGAHLATVADAAENATAFAFAATVPIDPADFPTTNHQSLMWLGGSAHAPVTDPASWSWDTGEPMTYTNWRAAEPSSGEACLLLLGREGGLWDNRDCSELYGYLCESD